MKTGVCLHPGAVRASTHKTLCQVLYYCIIIYIINTVYNNAVYYIQHYCVGTADAKNATDASSIRGLKEQDVTTCTINSISLPPSSHYTIQCLKYSLLTHLLKFQNQSALKVDPSLPIEQFSLSASSCSGGQKQPLPGNALYSVLCDCAGACWQQILTKIWPPAWGYRHTEGWEQHTSERVLEILGCFLPSEILMLPRDRKHTHKNHHILGRKESGIRKIGEEGIKKNIPKKSFV